MINSIGSTVSSRLAAEFSFMGSGAAASASVEFTSEMSKQWTEEMGVLYTFNEGNYGTYAIDLYADLARYKIKIYRYDIDYYVDYVCPPSSGSGSQIVIL